MANRIVLNETSYHGKGAVQDIVTEVKKRCFKKALVVTDPDLIKFHVADNVTKLLDANGLAYEVYDKVKANPTVNVVKGGVEMFKSIGADYIIAIGGGSSIDTAKGIAIIVNNPEHADVKSLEGADVTKKQVCADYRGSHHCRHCRGGHHQLCYYRRGKAPQICLRRLS